jgi:hypothetical protein
MMQKDERIVFSKSFRIEPSRFPATTHVNVALARLRLAGIAAAVPVVCRLRFGYRGPWKAGSGFLPDLRVVLVRKIEEPPFNERVGIRRKRAKAHDLLSVEFVG